MVWLSDVCCGCEGTAPSSPNWDSRNLQSVVPVSCPKSGQWPFSTAQKLWTREIRNSPQEVLNARVPFAPGTKILRRLFEVRQSQARREQAVNSAAPRPLSTWGQPTNPSKRNSRRNPSCPNTASVPARTGTRTKAGNPPIFSMALGQGHRSSGSPGAGPRWSAAQGRLSHARPLQIQLFPCGNQGAASLLWRINHHYSPLCISKHETALG